MEYGALAIVTRRAWHMPLLMEKVCCIPPSMDRFQMMKLT